MKITVRKIKYRLYGVGKLEGKQWTLLREKSFGVQLLYTTVKKAQLCAKWIRENGYTYHK